MLCKSCILQGVRRQVIRCVVQNSAAQAEQSRSIKYLRTSQTATFIKKPEPVWKGTAREHEDLEPTIELQYRVEQTSTVDSLLFLLDQNKELVNGQIVISALRRLHGMSGVGLSGVALIQDRIANIITAHKVMLSQDQVVKMLQLFYGIGPQLGPMTRAFLQQIDTSIWQQWESMKFIDKLSVLRVLSTMQVIGTELKIQQAIQQINKYQQQLNDSKELTNSVNKQEQLQKGRFELIRAITRLREVGDDEKQFVRISVQYLEGEVLQNFFDFICRLKNPFWIKYLAKDMTQKFQQQGNEGFRMLQLLQQKLNQGEKQTSK